MKIMIVDDEPDMLTIIGMVLRRLGGHQTIAVDDSTQALQIARREMPDAILMDVQMDGMDGPQVLASLASAAETRAIPVIFVSGCTDPEESARLVALGAKGLIAKPIEPKALIDQVRAILER